MDNSNEDVYNVHFILIFGSSNFKKFYHLTHKILPLPKETIDTTAIFYIICKKKFFSSFLKKRVIIIFICIWQRHHNKTQTIYIHVLPYKEQAVDFYQLLA